MVWIIFIAGWLIIGYYLAILIAPRCLRKTIDFFSIGSRLYLVGFIRLILGLMLLTLSSQARLWWYIVIIGLLSAASGLYLFFCALRRTKKLLGQIKNQSNLILRIIAIIALVLWGLLLYAIFPC